MESTAPMAAQCAAVHNHQVKKAKSGVHRIQPFDSPFDPSDDPRKCPGVSSILSFDPLDDPSVRPTRRDSLRSPCFGS